jgi:pyoverdine/dityrosine biosynthesis protein Dit1
MKALSIPTGFIGLAAVSSAAVINGPRFSVNLCTERDFNNCTHIVVESDKCSTFSFVAQSSQLELTSNS